MVGDHLRGWAGDIFTSRSRGRNSRRCRSRRWAGRSPTSGRSWSNSRRRASSSSAFRNCNRTTGNLDHSGWRRPKCAGSKIPTAIFVDDSVLEVSNAMAIQLDHMILAVNDRKKSIEFYAGILGLKYEGDREPFSILRVTPDLTLQIARGAPRAASILRSRCRARNSTRSSAG